MTRTIIIATLLFCPYAFADSVTAPPRANTGSVQTALDELRQAGYVDWKEGKLAAAIACYREVLRLSQSSHIPAEQFAQDLHSIGILSSDEGHYAEAQKYMERELDVLAGSRDEAATGRAHLSWLECSNSRARFPPRRRLTNPPSMHSAWRMTPKAQRR